MQTYPSWCNWYLAHRVKYIEISNSVKSSAAGEIASLILTLMPSLKIRETGLDNPPPELLPHFVSRDIAFAFPYSGQLLHEVESGEYSKSLCPSETSTAAGEGSSQLQTCVWSQTQCKLYLIVITVFRDVIDDSMISIFAASATSRLIFHCVLTAVRSSIVIQIHQQWCTKEVHSSVTLVTLYSGGGRMTTILIEAFS